MMKALKISTRKWIDEENGLMGIAILAILFFMPLLILCLEGTGSEISSNSCPQCLYIGLPILFGIFLPIILTLIFELPMKVFNKDSFIWNKCPYIIWILKCSIMAMFYWPMVLLILLAKQSVLLLIPIYLTWDFLKTILIVFTIPDGKAESKIKQIWSTKDKEDK